MPRSIQEILDHADDLAERFETYEPEARDERSLEEYQLERAAIDRARSERQIADAVIAARSKGCPGSGSAPSWERRPKLRSSATELSSTPPDRLPKT